MAKKEGPAAPPIPEWVLTYGDMMSLLLCFFILLSAFSELKKPDEYKEVIDAIKEAFGYQNGVGNSPSDDLPLNSVPSVLDDLLQSSTQKQRSENSIDNNTQGNNRKTQVIDEGKRFIVGGAMLFAPGSTELDGTLHRLLQTQIAPKIKGKTNRFEIRGHAYGTEDLASGIDAVRLSFERGLAVRDYLVNQCGIDPRSLVVLGFGDTEPQALRGPETANNRRVVVMETEVTAEERSPDYHFSGSDR